MRGGSGRLYTGAMTNTATNQESHYGNISAIQVDATSGSYPFRYPAVANTREHVLSILEGKDYPILPIRGYEVETVVDVGANVGAFTTYMAVHFNAAKYFCFEPSLGAVTFLRENIAQFPNAQVFPFGLYSEDTSMLLYEGASQSLQNSLYSSAETSASGNSVELRHAGRMFDELELNQISILKVDTEGSELPVLNSLSERFESIDQIYLEYHSEIDRREIDGLLGSTHALAAASAKHIHRGTNHYISMKLLREHPELDILRVDRS